jgi:hypothetical protein
VMSCSSVALSSPYTSSTPPPDISPSSYYKLRSQKRTEEEGLRNAGIEEGYFLPFNLLDQRSPAVLEKGGAAVPIYRGAGAGPPGREGGGG